MTATIKHPPPPADEEDLPDESESDDEDFRVDGEDGEPGGWSSRFA